MKSVLPLTFAALRLCVRFFFRYESSRKSVNCLYSGAKKKTNRNSREKAQKAQKMKSDTISELRGILLWPNPVFAQPSLRIPFGLASRYQLRVKSPSQRFASGPIIAMRHLHLRFVLLNTDPAAAGSPRTIGPLLLLVLLLICMAITGCASIQPSYVTSTGTNNVLNQDSQYTLTAIEFREL